jgi:adenosylmethionine-8-amino-7-oxononanoate aminotransferase
VLDLFERGDVVAANRERAARFSALAAPLRAHPRVRGFRHLGMIWAFEVEGAGAGFAMRAFEAALARGLLLRPIGNTVYFMPPYILTDEEFGLLVETGVVLAELEA